MLNDQPFSNMLISASVVIVILFFLDGEGGSQVPCETPGFVLNVDAVVSEDFCGSVLY